MTDAERTLLLELAFATAHLLADARQTAWACLIEQMRANVRDQPKPIYLQIGAVGPEAG